MPTNTLYSISLHFWFLIFCCVGHAQIIIQDNFNPTQLVQDYFAGPGISISNISFQGNLLQIGAFKNGTSSIQIDSGLVISTNQTKALDPSYNGTLQNAFSIQQDLDLKNIANSVPAMIGQNFTVTSVNDVAAIEFDFIPSADSVFFNFVFGTDEYMEWVNTPFNDVFAFLISGPGITGSYSSPIGFSGGANNIGLIPNSYNNLPITVSSVNANLNSDLYINNTNNVGVDVDGYTIKLKASAKVICGETYHLRLAIADGSDQMLESAVFLEAGSFSTPQITGQDTQHVCIGEQVNVSTIAPVGCDVEWFANNQASGTPIASGNTLIYAPNSSQTMYAFSTRGGCRSTFPFAVEIIVDSVQKPIGINVDTICMGQNTTILLQTESSTDIVWYDHSTMSGTPVSTENPLVISPDQSMSYFAFANREGCNSEPLEVQIEVLSIEMTPQITNPRCYNSNDGSIAITCLGGIPPYTYNWSVNAADTLVENLSEGNYLVTVSDQFGCQNNHTFTIQAPNAPFVSIQGTTSTCKDTREVFTLLAPENSEYVWSTGEATDTIEYLLEESKLLTVSLIDQTGCRISDSIFIDVKICNEPEMDSVYKTTPQEVQHLFIPNVFTPNADGQNDVFMIENNYLDGAKLLIYNRWGQLIFESQKNKLMWDGKTGQEKDVPPGNYYYILSSNNFKEEQQSGNITLIR